MLTLDPYSESVLYQCERCRTVGELLSQMLEEEGSYLCWSCLAELKKFERGRETHEVE